MTSLLEINANTTCFVFGGGDTNQEINIWIECDQYGKVGQVTLR